MYCPLSDIGSPAVVCALPAVHCDVTVTIIHIHTGTYSEVF